MDAAKEAINKLTSDYGHHTTEVTEHYNPAVTHEHVTRTRDHEDTAIIDKEIHQDHHHTTILPVKDQEVLPTEHSHRLAAAQHSEHHHGDHKGIHDKVAAEAASFQDRREVAPVEKTHSVAPTVAGEHHHHHVHETIQPIIQKQTIQPSVVHTTIPIHEVHHNEPKHYSASALPAVSLKEFQRQGGSLTGIADRVERFEGEPESIARNDAYASQATGTTSSGLNDTSRSGVTDTSRSGVTDTSRSGITDTSRSGITDTTTSNLNNTSASGISSTEPGTRTTGTKTGNETSRAQQAIDSRIDGPAYSGTGTTGTTGVGSTSTTNSTIRDSSNSGTSAGRSEGKPSLLQKLNPFKDSDGDGKKGIMS